MAMSKRWRSRTLEAVEDRGEACEDFLWSLINTQEFITIH